MSNPLALLPLAIAAAGGHVDGFEAQQLVAAGLTLKQRSVTLVKALATGRSAILLPAAPAFLVALAASDGSGALLIDSSLSDEDIAWQLADANVRVVFTVASLAGRLDAARTVVLLDAAPLRALVLADGRTAEVDLGSHHGLGLEGDQTAEGRDEECVLVYERGSGQPFERVALTHRALLASARMQDAVREAGAGAVASSQSWSSVTELTRVIAALLAGAHVTTGDEWTATRATSA